MSPTHRVRRIAPPGKKWCPRCESFKEKSGFNSGYCPECYKEYRKEWLKGHQDGDGILEIKKTAVRMYGGQCCRCHTQDINVLRIWPGGSKGEKALLYSLREKGWPDRYKLVCRNCSVYLRKENK